MKKIRIFISHSSKDKTLARRLVQSIETRIDVQPTEIRCTSVKGYKLPVGVDTARKLKKEISHAEAVIGIITPHSMKSTYVLFELGAAWGLGIPTFPLLAKGAKTKDLPGLLKGLNVARLTKRSETMQTLDDLCGRTRLVERRDNDALLMAKIDKVVNQAKEKS